MSGPFTPEQEARIREIVREEVAGLQPRIKLYGCRPSFPADILIGGEAFPPSDPKSAPGGQ